MFDSNLAKKFLERIDIMTFEELNTRASQAPSSGISGLFDELEVKNYAYIKIFKLGPFYIIKMLEGPFKDTYIVHCMYRHTGVYSSKDLRKSVYFIENYIK